MTVSALLCGNKSFFFVVFLLIMRRIYLQKLLRTQVLKMLYWRRQPSTSCMKKLFCICAKYNVNIPSTPLPPRHLRSRLVGVKPECGISRVQKTSNTFYVWLMSQGCVIKFMASCFVAHGSCRRCPRCSEPFQSARLGEKKKRGGHSV